MEIIMLVILVVIMLMTCIIVSLRIYNDRKYRNVDLAISVSDVADINQYPTKIEGIDVRYVDNGAFQGFHLTPNDKIYKGIVICFGGSEGSPNYDVAKSIAEKGYETLAVFMFGMKNQQKTLVTIPLEQFEDVLKYVNDSIKDYEPITVVAASKGAEYSLNLAVKYTEISNLILLAPVSYTFSGLDNTNHGSSWTWKNKEVPYIDIRKISPFTIITKIIIPNITKTPIAYKKIYEAAINANNDNDIEKRIPVKDIKANILMIAGEDDQMADSYNMAKMIKDENKNALLYSYKNAGHIFKGDGVLKLPNMRFVNGGTLDGNKQASLKAAKVIEDFLKSQHT